MTERRKKTVTCPRCTTYSRNVTRAQLRRWLRRHLTGEHGFTEDDAGREAHRVVPPAESQG